LLRLTVKTEAGGARMTLWLVRAGRNGEAENLALNEGLAVIGWGDIPDLSTLKSRDELAEIYRRTYPEAKPNAVSNQVGQIWAFRERIQLEHLVVLPLKTRNAVAIGKVIGAYQYRPDHSEDARHTHAVNWIKKDIPRSAFDQDILYSLGALMTVCQIQRNRAEERIQALLEGHEFTPSNESVPTMNAGIDTVVDTVAAPNLEEYASDQIRTFIGQKFREHELARLVNALLNAQGYKTLMSPPGPDGGVDIIAGRGPMGFDHPRLCVQVKSSAGPMDVKTLRELQGVMKNFGAEHGLFVSWGGFKQSVYTEARQRFFEIRLWDAGDLVEVLLEQYDRLAEDLKAELPLKRIWLLVPNE
jgi:restriction system protein